MKETRSLRGQRPPHMERVYVKVNSDFDATGYMQPRSITWADGRTFQIEAVKDYRPAACYRQGAEGSCYTVMIRGRNVICSSNGQTRPSPAGSPAGMWRQQRKQTD